MLKSRRSCVSSPPPNALRIKCVLALSSTNAQDPLSALLPLLSLPSTVREPAVVGTRDGRVDLGIRPFIPERYPPTRDTTSSEVSWSHNPSVARTRNRSVDLEAGVDGSASGGIVSLR
jgi:hypothetical protein